MNQGATIKKLCKQQGITQKKLAYAIGKSTTAVNQIIKGTYSATPETIIKICTVFNITVDIFYYMCITKEEPIGYGLDEAFILLNQYQSLQLKHIVN